MLKMKHVGKETTAPNPSPPKERHRGSASARAAGHMLHLPLCGQNKGRGPALGSPSNPPCGGAVRTSQAHHPGQLSAGNLGILKAHISRVNPALGPPCTLLQVFPGKGKGSTIHRHTRAHTHIHKHRHTRIHVNMGTQGYAHMGTCI